MNKQIAVAGIDVGKFNLDISISSTQEHRRMQNHEDAFATLVEWLREAGVERVVLEPTGRYHRAVSRRLRDAGFAVMEINPLRARRFAEALGGFGKNDRVDAAMLARLGQVMEFETRTPRSHAQTELGNLARGRSRLINSRTGLSLALAEFQEQPAVVAALEAAIRELDKQTAALEAAIRRHIGEHAELARRDEILRSIPGVGPVTAALLCAEMPELGSVDRRQAAALLGVAPLDDDSETRSETRHIQGGRAAPRTALYMAATSAATWNPDMQAFYQRLRGEGKEHKVAIVAVIRKLIVLANVLLNQDRHWLPVAPTAAGSSSMSITC